MLFPTDPKNSFWSFVIPLKFHLKVLKFHVLDWKWHYGENFKDFFFFFQNTKNYFWWKLFANSQINNFWNIFGTFFEIFISCICITFLSFKHTPTSFKDTKNTFLIKWTHMHSYTKTKMTSYIFLLKIFWKVFFGRKLR